ncbi:PREDICTED: LOW QUALITY PROTEIN: adenylate kinase isoenzyme 6 homolog [Atta cephalotes]|uniref:Uncharacterized protein n=1 Tax=Atta cephalotes TaxID=12957 RepID=A0A158NPK2_ATTCE|nr:PREDICTED: LOW QUALITY PROTEIN: adenylate kinase isoenzyme 6 homolog [Atta cephalotes]
MSKSCNIIEAHWSMLEHATRTNLSSPNILICGPPGVGKSTLANLLKENTELNTIDVSKIAIDTGCVSDTGCMTKLQCSILDGNTVIIFVAIGPFPS